MVTKRHYPPAVKRYQDSHPAIIIHVTKKDFEKVKDIAKKEGISMSELIRRNTLTNFEPYNKGYDKGYLDGYMKAEEDYNIPDEKKNSQWA
jgi:hypothetical protein